MNFEEHAAKPVLAAAGIRTPRGRVVTHPDEAARAAIELGPVAVKAQVPAGKRGLAGGIELADSPAAAAESAARILGMRIAGHTVSRLLVEERCAIAAEYYAAVLTDPASKGPLVLFSAEGGMEVEQLAASREGALRRARVDIRHGFGAEAAAALLEGVALGGRAAGAAQVLSALYRVYAANDAELVEINPLAASPSGDLIALDCKLVLDDAAAGRRPELAARAVPEPLTALEVKARAAGLKYIELDGDIGVLANGAGLTMTTMDVVRHLGGRPANFLEIGGDAYTRAQPALELVLENPRVQSLVVNFCGAFARTDVMVEGVIGAWRALSPAVPVFFSVHGTGEAQAIAMLRAELGVEPFDTMDEAIAAAIEAARAQR